MSNEFCRLFSDEQPLDAAWPRPYIGIDEAGRGCLAGPVVAGAVILPENHQIAGLTDSKKLTEKKREKLLPVIQEQAAAWGIGLAWPEEIDRINILQATFLAMSRAVRALSQSTVAYPLADAPQMLVIDGNQRIPEDVLDNTSKHFLPESNFHMLGTLSRWNCEMTLPVAHFICPKEPAGESVTSAPLAIPTNIAQTTVIKGDLKIPAISAASVLAKTFRDHIMVRLEDTYSGYGFAKHKGYGTKAHLAAIRQLGACPQHRMTFGGVRQGPKNSSASKQGSLI